MPEYWAPSFETILAYRGLLMIKSWKIGVLKKVPDAWVLSPLFWDDTRKIGLLIKLKIVSLISYRKTWIIAWTTSEKNIVHHYQQGQDRSKCLCGVKWSERYYEREKHLPCWFPTTNPVNTMSAIPKSRAITKSASKTLSPLVADLRQEVPRKKEKITAIVKKQYYKYWAWIKKY